MKHMFSIRTGVLSLGLLISLLFLGSCSFTDESQKLDDMEKIPGWSVYVHDDSTFAFQYPSKIVSIRNANGENLSLFPMTGEEAPYMTIKRTSEKIDALVKQFGEEQIYDIFPPINGLSGKVIGREAPIAYLFQHGKKTYILSLWEGLAWEHFETVAKSFTVLEDF